MKNPLTIQETEASELNSVVMRGMAVATCSKGKARSEFAHRQHPFFEKISFR